MVHFAKLTSSPNYTTEILKVKDEPALCFSIGFALDSNIVTPKVLHYGDLAKQVFMKPFVYELDRMFSFVAVAADVPSIEFRCYGPGIKIFTRSRPDGWKRMYYFLCFIGLCY